GLAQSGLNYGDDIGMSAEAALKTFTANADKISPTAHALQASPAGFAIYGATVSHIADAIAGRQSLEQAYDLIEQDVAKASER
ncbi:MAG: hypothetical protein AAGC83_14895, partial [Pseudomonadota bacterium]